MSDTARQLYVTSWTDRFLAWIIDVILVGAILTSLGEIVGVVSLLTGGIVSSSLAGLNGLGFFLYWTLLEGYQGQSAGKLVMKIAVTDERGDPIDYPTAAVESFGKAFVLPLDCLIGWIAYDGEGLRLFNKLSETIVVDVDESADERPSDVEYVYPSER